MNTEPLNLTTLNLIIGDWHSDSNHFAVQTGSTQHQFLNIPLLPRHQLKASLKPVSGIGNYSTVSTAPPIASATPVVRKLQLLLIQHTTRAFLDGKLQRSVDPANPMLLLGPLEGGRQYELTVEVTTMLLNRIRAE